MTEEDILPEYKEKRAWGMSSSIDLHDCDADLIRDEKKIKEFLGKFGFSCKKVLDFRNFVFAKK